MYKLAFFVPESHRDSVKEALFAAGAGRIGDYDACCWQTLGEGQFRPSASSTPFIGQHGQLEKVPEWKVEMVCCDEYIAAVIAALRYHHPYEEPAFDVWQLSDF